MNKVAKKITKDLNDKFNVASLQKEVNKGYMRELRKNLLKFKKSGALLKSFKIVIRNKKTLVLSNSPYAMIQNFGGRIRITERMRSAMWALYKETGRSVYKAIALTKKTYMILRGHDYLNIDMDKIVDEATKKTFK